MANSADDTMSRELECTICGCIMIDPRVLHCQHAFCLRCIFTLIKRDRSPNPNVKCPFGCQEAGSIEGDIRSLKRNPLIASLCGTARKALLPHSPTSATCDWCNAEGVSCRMCAKCSCIICTKCDAEEPFSDHGYLCLQSDRAAKSDPQHACETRDGVTSFDSLVHGNVAMESVNRFLMDKICGSNGCASTEVKIDAPCTSWVPHFVQQCCCKGVTADGIDVEGRFNVIVPLEAESILANVSKKLSEERLWDSRELSLLAKCSQTVERTNGFVTQSITGANQLRKALLISSNITDVQLVASLVVIHRQIYDGVEFVILPLMRRTTLFANFLGHKYVERQCQLFANANSSQCKKQIVRRIRVHLELGGALVSQLSHCMESLESSLGRLGEAISTLEDAITDVHAKLTASFGTTPDESPPAKRRISRLLQLPSRMQTLHETLVGIMDLVKESVATLTAESPEATRGIGVDDASRNNTLALEQKFVQEVDKFFGLCGSVQHLHVLWVQCVVVVGKRFERNQFDAFVKGRRGRYALHKSLRLTDLDENVEEATRLMALIAPQINKIREQHIALLQRNPSSMNNLLVLVGQLCHLTTQVLDVYQKEHFIKIKELNNSGTEYLLQFSSTVTTRFIEAQPKEVAKEIIGELSAVPSFDTSGPFVSKMLTNLGTQLTRRSVIVSQDSRLLLDQAREMGRCAAAFLHNNLEAPYVLPVSHGVGDFGGATYNESIKETAVSQALRRIVLDAPKVVERTVVVELGPVQRVLLPYHRGFFWLPTRCPGRLFEYIVDAQTGDFVVEDFPQSSMERFLGAVESIIGRKLWFAVANASLLGATYVSHWLR